MKAGDRKAKPGARSNGRAGSSARRRRLMAWMRSKKGPLPGNELARHFHVSRQCLVQDVAMLRAGGAEIISTPQGYRLPRGQSAAHRAVIACKHPPERTEEELQILVDHGVRVIDVIVEHPLYGELRGALMLESRNDIEEFSRRWRGTKATLLSSLTRGVHLHTIEASKPAAIANAKSQLRARGFLLNK